MPDGYKFAPHIASRTGENVTVLVGTLKVGMGDQFDASKMMSFAPAVSPISIRVCTTTPRLPGRLSFRFTACRRRQINYINPADDPSKK